MLSQKPYSYRLFGEIEYISISSIKTSSLYNCRDINQIVIETISESIKQYGLIQPIVIRVAVTAVEDRAIVEDNHYEIVAGCRRYMSCKILNWKKIPCHIVHLNDKQAFEISLVENIQRESLSPLEEAKSFKKYVIDNGWGSISNLSSKIGKSHSYITKRIAMLDLPLDVQQSIKNYELKPSSAEELLYIKDPEIQSQLGKMILKRHLTTMKARKLVKEDPYYCENSEIIETRSELQAINKSIVILKIAMSKIAELVEDENEEEEENEKNYNDINDNNGTNSKVLRERNNRNSNGITNSKSNWLIKELLMYQKKQLHDQIDILLKAKKKYVKNIVRYRQIMER
ncbi:MAG TPA: ParB/RepB/Spo0J family partition protein [Candidatus Nitrosocosmicus sp.]